MPHQGDDKPSAAQPSQPSQPLQRPAAQASTARAPGLDDAAFSELVSGLLSTAADAAVAGRLDAALSCRLLWALAKLSVGSRTAEPASRAPRAPSGQRPGPQASAEAAKGSGQPALTAEAMRRDGERCAAALAVIVVEGLEDSAARTAKTGVGNGLPYGMYEWLLVMGMWGAARLTTSGFLRLPSVANAAAASATAAAAASSIGVSRGRLWATLGSAVFPLVGCLQPRELSNAMWALAAVDEHHRPAFSALAEAIEPHLAAAAGEGAVTAGASLGFFGSAARAVVAESRASPPGPQRQGQVPSSRDGPERKGDVNAQDLANTVWALARARSDPDAPLLRSAEGAVLRTLGLLGPQHVASLLWSFAVLDYVPQQPSTAGTQAQAQARPGGRTPNGRGAGRGPAPASALYEGLAKRAAQLRVTERGDEGLSAQVVWALVRLRLIGPRSLAAAAERLVLGAERLSLREAAMVASAFCDARHPAPRLFSALLRRAASLPAHALTEGPGADVSVALLMRGLAWAGVYDPAVFSRLCTALQRRLPAIQPQPLAMALRALALVRHRQPDFLARAATVAAAIAPQFNGGELATVALSLAQLGVRSPQFFDSAARCFTNLRGSGRPGGNGRAAPAEEVGGRQGPSAAGEAAAAGAVSKDSRRWAALVPGEAPEHGEEGAEEAEEAEDDEEEEGGEEELVDDEEAEDEEDEAAEEAEEAEDESSPVSGPAGAAATRAAGSRARAPRKRAGRQLYKSVVLNRHRDRWRLVDLLLPQEVATAMAAFAVSGHVDEEFYFRAQVRAQRLLKYSESLRRRQKRLVASAGGAPIDSTDFSAGAAVKLLWALVAVGCDPEQTPLLSALSRRIRQLLPRLEPRDIASLAWAIATSRLHGSEDLLARAVAGAGRHAEAFLPRDLATVAWSAAVVGLEDVGLLSACEKAVLTSAAAAGASAAGTMPAAAADGMGAETARGAWARGLSLQTLSDIVWAHSALRHYRPELLAAAAGLAADRLAAVNAAAERGGGGGSSGGGSADGSSLALHMSYDQGDVGGPGGGVSAAALAAAAGATAAAAAAAAAAVVAEPEPELGHVVALLEAYAVWVAGAAAAAGGAGPYHDGLFRSAAALLCRRVDDLTADQVVAAAWSAAAVLHALPPPPPLPSDTDVAQADPHPVLALLDALSDALAETRPDSFLQPELVQLAQASAAAADFAAAAGLDAPPLELPPPLAALVAGAWGAAPGGYRRRTVVELATAVEAAGFWEVRMDARSEDGVVPIDVAATAPPAVAAAAAVARQVDRPGGRPTPPAAGSGSGGEAGWERYAFLDATPEGYARGRPGTLCGALGLRARLLAARGWRVVPVAGGDARTEAAAVWGPPRARQYGAARDTRERVRQALAEALAAMREGSGSGR
ncbi:hypothetical protein HYH03_017325 [Edaphochlamys debaryana]|uniref:RAP domain-containing protein n=1 Tax=Edaphochlamys debaryana TaxID=47281 RepID=A0A835XIK6_9CHLO|nr:hypothetical protein HYH03_017325 [Edaphochlamys debaryana]|eukprot:KAG2483802.1 hypothetical protein HYH03_017325 [Edaphochlamys debaryana]